YIISTGYEGYIDNQRTVTVAENEQLTNQDLVLSPVLAEGEIRIILTWGESPADLESHLTAPNETGCRHHCYYWNKNIPTANLDLDDRNGFGPETITITDAAAGTYRYYVHDFTNRNTYYTQWLARSGAEVKVYSGSNEPLVFTVPSGYGTGWHVFDLDGETGEIIPVNTLFRQSEPGRIDYPSITSSITYGYAYWGTLYTYQVQAADPDDDTLTYSLTEAPDGMVIDPDTGMIEWTPFSTQSGWYYTTVKVEDGRCGEVTQRFRVYVYSQPTANFFVDPCSGVNPGGNITLTWSTTLAATVFIDQGIGEVPANGSLTIPSPEAPTLYTLTAFNDAALTKRTTPAVPWRSFYFSPASIPLGGSTTLYWNSPCSTDRSIDHEIGEVPVSGSVEVTPTTTGWSYYYLTATNAGGSNKYWARVYAYPPAPPTASIAVTPTCNLTPGEEKTLSWQTTNATEVTISPDIGSVESSGSRLIYPATSGIYTITATGLGGTVSRTVEYPNSPGLSFYSSTYYLDTGGSAILNWSAGCADTAILNQGIGEVPTVGSMEVSPETFPVTYTMIVENERSSYSRNVTLQQHLPSISFSASPSNTINPGDSVTLNWTVKYADTLTMNQGVGPVEASGSLTITPETLPLTYTLTSVNERGSAARSVTLYYTPPRGTLTAEPLQLKVGDSTTLTWTSTNAETCTITPDIGEVDCNGSMEVTPTSSPTYYLFEMVGSGGIYRRGVYVSFVAPTADLKTSAATVNEGESVELSWVFANATSCIIDQGIGEVEPGGVQTVTPPVTTTYTMTATGPGGTVTDQVTVTVIPANPTPTVNLTTNKIRIIRGDSVVLSWESSYADSLLIEPDVGTAALNGSATMTPEVTTTYTATAVNTDGTATDTVTVTVIPPSPTVNLTAEPANIMAGESAVLTWTSSNADSIVFNQGIGEEQLQGSLTVSPTETTTYVATATGQGGTTSKSITVTVTYPEPTASLNADPASIGFGYSTTLSWTTQDAQDCTIEPNIGAVDCAAGEQSVYLLQDTT
ncbi:hypothetical protein VU13_01795, partial [Desulfobulbus sp. US5]|nr:hypothetical protein [Desulfobulbus sp. US5]